MCNEAVIIFVARALSPDDVRGKRVVELGVGPVGAKPLLMSWKPAAYVGVDVQRTPWSDVVLSPEEIVPALGAGGFDVVLSTEMLEHARDWRLVVTNLKSLCKPGGRIVVTTRSRGYQFHAPPDYWRYEVSDARQIFADSSDLMVETDPMMPGVFIAARRPVDDHPFTDLSGVALYSILTRRRMVEIPVGSSRWTTTREMWKARASMVARMALGTVRGEPPIIRFPPPRKR